MNIKIQLNKYPDCYIAHMTAPSGDYEGVIDLIKGTVTFDLIIDKPNQELNDDSWPDVIGPHHVFTYLTDLIGGIIEVVQDDAIQATFEIVPLIAACNNLINED